MSGCCSVVVRVDIFWKVSVAGNEAIVSNFRFRPLIMQAQIVHTGFRGTGFKIYEQRKRVLP
jgi:hypothetical protein